MTLRLTTADAWRAAEAVHLLTAVHEFDRLDAWRSAAAGAVRRAFGAGRTLMQLPPCRAGDAPVAGAATCFWGHEVAPEHRFMDSAIGHNFRDMRERVIGISIRGLRDAPDAGLSVPTTPEERLALVETLTREAWALAGGSLPTYARTDAPVRLRPLRAGARPASR